MTRIFTAALYETQLYAPIRLSNMHVSSQAMISEARGAFQQVISKRSTAQQTLAGAKCS